MKNKKIILISALLVLFLTFAVYFYFKINPSKPSESQPPKVEESVSADIYYVPVTNYFSEVQNVGLTELKNRDIIAEVGEGERIKSLLSPFVGQIVEKNLGEIKANTKEGELAIIKWNSTGSKLKTLSVDGIYLWDIEQGGAYPLKKNIQLTTAEKQKINFEPEKITKITFGGDVMLSRHVATKIRSLGELAPWKWVGEFFQKSDISFINLEVPLSDRFPAPTQGMSFIAPTKYAQGLTASGIDVVSVANNHTANFGQKVFDDNLQTLAKNEILACGGGENEAAARSPKIIERNNLKFAFLCTNAIVGGLDADTDSGTAGLKIEPWYRDNEQSIRKLEEDIQVAEKIADVVIVSPHWGVEYKVNPNNSQKLVAKRIIDAGADLVVGTHPHVVQGFEFYKDNFIFYSLGNLIFDQEWSLETKQGLIVESYFYGKNNIANKSIPIEISGYYLPKMAIEKNANQIMTRIKSASFGF